MSNLSQFTTHLLESANEQRDKRCEDDVTFEEEGVCFLGRRNQSSTNPFAQSNSHISSDATFSAVSKSNVENYLKEYMNDTNRFMTENCLINPVSSHLSSYMSTGAMRLQIQNCHQFPHGQIGLDTDAQTEQMTASLHSQAAAIQAASTAYHPRPSLPSMPDHIQNETLVHQHFIDARKNASQQTLKSSTAENCNIVISPQSVLEHWKTRSFVPLSTPDDSLWLSEFNHFLRAECLEVIQASTEDVVGRRKAQKILEGQVGIRCRFCAHLSPAERINGSSVFPLKTRTIYQRVITMVKYHFPRCLEMPSDVRVNYITLKGKRGKGNIRHGKQHWEVSAGMIGIKDGDDGGLFLSSL